MAPYDPFVRSTHSREECARIFGPKADAKVAAKLHRENPALYAQVREESVQYGLVGQPSYLTQRDVDNLPMNARQRNFTEAEVRARAKYSEQEVRALYSKPADAPGENLDSIRKSDPAKYAELREAAASYGIIPAQSAAPRPRVIPPTPESRFPLSDKMCEELNLPKNYLTDAETFGTLLRVMQEKAERLAAEQAAASAVEPAADPAGSSSEGKAA